MYRYFVSYVFMSRSGAPRFGNFEIRRETLIAGHEDIAELNQTIKENISAQPHGDIVITNFIRFEDAPAPAPSGGDLSAGARTALLKMREMLDGWIEGQRGNHEALKHRYENAGEECWNRWHSDDIRRMIDDAANESGLPSDWREAHR